jgi:hypothetical protein
LRFRFVSGLAGRHKRIAFKVQTISDLNQRLK